MQETASKDAVFFVSFLMLFFVLKFEKYFAAG